MWATASPSLGLTSRTRFHSETTEHPLARLSSPCSNFLGVERRRNSRAQYELAGDLYVDCPNVRREREMPESKSSTTTSRDR